MAISTSILAEPLRSALRRRRNTASRRRTAPVSPGPTAASRPGAHAPDMRQQAQVARHREQEQRNGEDQADDQQAALVFDLLLARLGLGILRLAAEFERLEAGRWRPPGADSAWLTTVGI